MSQTVLGRWAGLSDRNDRREPLYQRELWPRYQETYKNAKRHLQYIEAYIEAYYGKPR